MRHPTLAPRHPCQYCHEPVQADEDIGMARVILARHLLACRHAPAEAKEAAAAVPGVGVAQGQLRPGRTPRISGADMLAALAARGPSKSSELAEAMGEPDYMIRAHLDRLFRARKVTRRRVNGKMGNRPYLYTAGCPTDADAEDEG